MSVLRAALLHILFEGSRVREPYVDIVKSLLNDEFHPINTYAFYDSSLRQEGTVYVIGKQEVYYLDANGIRPKMIIVRDANLRESILNLLALHPLYAIWFG